MLWLTANILVIAMENRIYRTKNEFDKRGKIPVNYLATLERRLVTACKPLLKDRLQPGPVPRTMQEIRLTSTDMALVIDRQTAY